MRRSIWLSLLLVVGLGFGLFQLKYQVQGLEQKLTRINRDILQNEEAIHVLKAEWSYLNKLDRIEAEARKHLDLQPFTGKQYGSIDDLPMRADPNAAPADETAPTSENPVASGTPLPTRRPPFASGGGKVTLVREVQ